MKISTKGRYGTRALLELALHYGEGPIRLKDIARTQQIPLQYLEHIIAPLVTSEIIRSTRGAGGGVCLARPPQKIKLSEVIGVLEGSIALAECVNDPSSCSRVELCVTHDIWSELEKVMNGVLEFTTLQNLVERQKRKEQPKEIMYNI